MIGIFCYNKHGYNELLFDLCSKHSEVGPTTGENIVYFVIYLLFVDDKESTTILFLLILFPTLT